MNPILTLILITLVPLFELRASIPYGIFQTNLHWFIIFFVCIATNMVLGVVVYFFLDKIIHLFLHIKIIDKCYSKHVEKTQRKIHKYVEKYGEFAVAVFIAIPLPGSGSYTGALAAYIIDLGYKRFVIANMIGVLVAGILVTIISLSGFKALFWIF